MSIFSFLKKCNIFLCPLNYQVLLKIFFNIFMCFLFFIFCDIFFWSLLFVLAFCLFCMYVCVFFVIVVLYNLWTCSNYCKFLLGISKIKFLLSFAVVSFTFCGRVLVWGCKDTWGVSIAGDQFHIDLDYTDCFDLRKKSLNLQIWTFTNWYTEFFR